MIRGCDDVCVQQTNQASSHQAGAHQGFRLTLAGVTIGLAVAFALNRLLTSLLCGVAPFDQPTIAAVVALMAGVALVACYLPALGATRVDPMIVLRED